MTKLRRSLSPHDIVHVNVRAILEIPLFRDDGDREYFIRLLERVAARFGWVVHGYTLMTTHYHLIVEAPAGTLSAGMQVLNGGYARTYNKRYGRIGHALMSRFHSTRVTVEQHFLQACRYVALNAPRAGLCVHPRDWDWSNYPASVGLQKPPAFLKLDKLLGHFDSDRATAMRRFAEFVADGLARPAPAER